MLEKTLFVVMLIPVSIMSGGLSYKAALNLWPLNGYPIGALIIALGSGYICWMTLKYSYLMVTGKFVEAPVRDNEEPR